MPTPASAANPIPPMMHDMAQRVGWAVKDVGGVWAFLLRLRPSRWSRGVHQAVAHELLLAMVPGVGPHLVGQIYLQAIQVVDPVGEVRPWDLDEVDHDGYLRTAWRPGNTSQGANFLASAAATEPSLQMDAVTLDDGGHDLVTGSSISDTLFTDR